MRLKYSVVIAALCVAATSVLAQSVSTCLPTAASDYQSIVFLNFGFANNSFSTKFRTSATVGQPLVETGLSTSNVTTTGYWSQFLVPPLPPTVTASQGEYLDRIQLNWRPNPLGAAPSVGYKLFRDGVFQALLDPNTFNYNDYNVIAGKSYKYSVRGVNEYGDGCATDAVGFMVPNGTVTGWASTRNSNAVPDVLVSLMPLQGYSLVLDADPVTGAYGGAVAIDTTNGNRYFPTTGTQDYTLTFWVKNSGSQTGTLIEFDGYPLEVRGYGDGVQVFLNNSAVTEKVLFDPGTETKWHHIAISHTNQVFRLYLDGNLKTLVSAGLPIGFSNRLYLGNKERTNTGWSGNLDELRIYHRRLTEIDLREVLVGTASSSTPDLKYYWKFDEQLGNNSFDIMNRLKLYFCGAYFSTAMFASGSRTDIPMVCTSARTDETGFYTIESASYGTGTTFIARPSKFFYLNWALQFAKNSKSYATLPDFALPPQSTIEMTVYSDGPDPAPQTLLSKKWGANNFSLKLMQNQSDQTKSDLLIDINGGTGQNSVVGQLPTGYTHLAFNIDSTSADTRTITTYVNGTLKSTNVFSNITGNWSDTTTRWILGADRTGLGDINNENNFNNFYSGLIDEFVVYNSKLDSLKIKGHNLVAREMTEPGIIVYFTLDEGDGPTLNNCGSLPLGFGYLYNTRWNSFAKFGKVEPHEFLPATRQVTLNPSVTSVDQVDFTDISSIPVSGFVRYSNTDCFADQVEITNDGLPFSPPIFTDSVGRFIIDVQPGKSFRLKPKFEDHQFIPAFWDITKVTTPIAGIVFNDNTTRTVKVTVAGGDCKVSTLGDNLGTDYKSLKLQIRNAGNDCYERYGEMTDGITYEFRNVPPFRQLNVGLFSHENNDIKNAIQSIGAYTVDITKRDTALEFIYRNPELEVDIYDGLAPTCNDLKYWDPPLPAGATADSVRVRKWTPPLPLGATPDYTNMKVIFNSTSLPIVNNQINIGTTTYTYSEYNINLGSGTVNISSNVHTLTPSVAKTILEQGSNETVKLRIQEEYPGGTCILNEADLRFVNGLADEVKETNLVAATHSHTGVLAAPSGNPLANKSIKVRLTLQPLINSSQSHAYYREVHTVKTNDTGGYTVVLGNGVRDTIVKGTFAEVPWYPSTDAPFLKVEVDTVTNGNYLQHGTTARVIHPPTTHTYKFKVGDTNPVSPYYKTMQVIATTPDGRQGSTDRVAVISGTRPNGERFTTYLPEKPTLILRDPPGDGSYAYISKDSTVCRSYSFQFEKGGSLLIEKEFDTTPKTYTVAAPLGIGTMVEAEGGVNVSGSFQVGYSRIDDKGWETCMTFNNIISTSDADIIVGGDQGGDVYVGTAQNIIFGTSDQIKVDKCVIQANQVIVFKPGKPTVFRYSEYFIKHYLIPYLGTLAIAYDGVGKTDSANIMRQSSQLWKDYIELNNQTKNSAKFESNVSFDAGTTYEGSITSSRDDYEASDDVAEEIVSLFTKINLSIAGLGFEFDLTTEVAFNETFHNENSKSKATTTGYVLADDDPGDAFSVDILNDPVFGTPVFKIKSGQSSCPWEKGTASRDKPLLEPVAGYPLEAINIPSKEAAVFRFNLGNNSQTYETRSYNLSASNEDNPHGAVIKLNGAVLNSDASYSVESQKSVEATITVERGPVEYIYEDLVIGFSSGCETDTFNQLAFTSQNISVNFVRPCSEVDIDYPRNNYVILRNDLAVTPTNSTVRDIIVNNYSLIDPNFQAIRVQYRRADGNGIWTNILAPATFTGSNPHERWNSKNPDYLAWSGSPNPDTLGPISTTFQWETAGLVDGEYELRAISVCGGPAAGMEGSSYYIPIRIDRDAPKIVAFEPSDGVYNIGDEISVTFDKPLNTSRFAPPTGNPFGKVDLFDTEPLAGTGQIDVTVTAYENKIFIVPNVLNKFMENKILRLELKDLEDLVGNNTGNNPMKWLNKVPEFYVNRNELAWLTDSVGMTKRMENTKTIQVNIHNSGGYPVPFEIRDYPDWVHVVPNTGTLAPNEIRAISFTADSTLAFGYWQDSVTLRTLTGVAPPLAFMGGDERIPLGVRVVCSPPAWALDPGQFEGSMNLVLKLNVQGTISTDEEDIVGAFIDGQLRGRANVQYVPQVSYPGNNVYLAYLTVYGSAADLNKPVSLQIWDASACLLYGTVAESYGFIPDGINGDANAPATATTNSMVLRQIPVTPGWNWISFNLAFPNPAINTALSSLKYPANDLVKSQTQFANYFGSAWVGSLTTLDNRKMYQYRADRADTIQMLGLCLPDTMSVYVKTGWNWIGYLPSFSLPVNSALSKLRTDGVIQAGDLIKSRTGFAQYIVNPVYTGWLGNLEYMMPPYGYQLKLTRSGVAGAKLTYPPQGLIGDGSHAANRGGNMPAFWTVDPSQYESSATLIGMLGVNGNNLTGASMELGAFVGDEVRGSAQAMFVEPLNSYLFFLTYYSNNNGDPISFKLYDSDNGLIRELAQTMFFTADNHQGSMDIPFPFSYSGLSGTEDVLSDGLSLDVRPNPFSQSTEIRFALKQASPAYITVTDLNGKTVSFFEGYGQEGMNAIEWKGTSYSGVPLQPGVYFVKLKTDAGMAIRKVMIQR
jgi:hypothetical protein